jgi:dihydropyrimidinase
MAVTWFDTPEVRREFRWCVDNGITSFKTFMAYKGSLGIDDDELFKVLQHGRDNGVLVTVHAENGDLVNNLIARHRAEGRLDPLWHARSRPPECEGEATHRAITLARFNGTPLYIVHMTCADALRRVREARAEGQVVWAETCPQYLVFDESVYTRPDFEGAKWVMSPPIRPAGHQDALWAGIREGLIQTVATDHCPFYFKGQKEMGRDDFSKIPNGAPGIQDRMSVMYHYGVVAGRIDVHQWIDTCCTRPARIFDLYPRKGTIAVGSDADVVVFDPGATFTFSAKDSAQRVDYNLYEGMPGSGRCDLVYSRGRLLWERGEWRGKPGMGSYLSRSVGQAPALQS